jgi:hypothetical protein
LVNVQLTYCTTPHSTAQTASPRCRSLHHRPPINHLHSRPRSLTPIAQKRAGVLPASCSPSFVSFPPIVRLFFFLAPPKKEARPASSLLSASPFRAHARLNATLTCPVSGPGLHIRCTPLSGDPSSYHPPANRLRARWLAARGLAGLHPVLLQRVSKLRGLAQRL